MPSQLTDEQVAEWSRTGRVVIRGGLDAETVSAVSDAVSEVERWASNGGPGLHHFEMTDNGPKIARSEDFFNSHPVLRALLTAEALTAPLAQLLGEPPVLFKEKINYKHAGGAGFAPHQDATAYRFVDHHISVMVPIDTATVESGCLWFTAEAVLEVLDNEAGRIDPAWVAAQVWEPVEVEPGDIVLFDSLTPHYSETNNSGGSRRAMYLTYNASSDGDHRDAYYADKRALLDTVGDGSDRVRISVNDDFLGRPVPSV